MRVKAETVQKFLLGAALLGALGWNLAEAAEVRGVQIAQGATGTRAEIALDVVPGDYRLLTLANPDRLVVDLPASSVRPGAAVPGPSGVVRGVRYGQPQPGVARIVFDLAQPVAALRPEIESATTGSRLVIQWPGDGAAPVAAAPVVPAATIPQPAVPATPIQPQTAAVGPVVAATPVTTPADPIADLLAREAFAPAPAIATQGVHAAEPLVLPPPVKSLRDPAPAHAPRPLIIAIDAGHGGQDPGAIGLSGKREKDITLAIARELARQLNATPGYRAYLTRDADVFLQLNQRTRLARDAKADMFVSIHADAAENRAARGSSVYVLSLKGASSQRARWLADKENAADLIGGVKVEPGNTLASVLLDLTQSGNMRASEDAAGQVLAGLAKIGPNHKRSVERANFAVLRTSDIPAMLVETAFISNPEEEQRLADPAHQRQIARAVLDGVNTYFSRQPPPGTLLAAKLEAEMRAVASAGGASAGSSAGSR